MPEREGRKEKREKRKGKKRKTRKGLSIMESLRNRRAFTLVEVMITVGVAAVVLLAVVAGITFSTKAQKLAREHSLAQRQAAALIEEARSQPFRLLDNQIDDPERDEDNDLKTRVVLIDDRRTEDPEDNLTGIARLRLFREPGKSGNLQEISDATKIDTGSGVETIEDYLIIQAEVTWESLGEERRVALLTHFAP